MTAIIFSDDDDASWCDWCDARLFERKDGSMVCSNGECGRIYSAESTTKHHTTLRPVIDPYSNQGPELISMPEYATGRQKLKPTPGEVEDKYLERKKSGFHITDATELFP